MVYGHIMLRSGVKPRLRKRNGLWVCSLANDFHVGTGNTADEAYQYWLKGHQTLQYSTPKHSA